MFWLRQEGPPAAAFAEVQPALLDARRLGRLPFVSAAREAGGRMSQGPHQVCIPGIM